MLHSICQKQWKRENYFISYDCFPLQRAERIPISVPLNQEIAEEIYERLKQTQHVSFPKDYWRDRAWDEEVKH